MPPFEPLLQPFTTIAITKLLLQISQAFSVHLYHLHDFYCFFSYYFSSWFIHQSYLQTHCCT